MPCGPPVEANSTRSGAVFAHGGRGPLFPRKSRLMPVEPCAGSGQPIRMTDEDTSAEIAAAVAETPELLLRDVAYYMK